MAKISSKERVIFGTDSQQQRSGSITLTCFNFNTNTKACNVSYTGNWSPFCHALQLFCNVLAANVLMWLWCTSNSIYVIALPFDDHLFVVMLVGRVYLSQIPILLKLLTEALRKEDKDSLTRENVLVALQKLSLRYLFKWQVYFQICAFSLSIEGRQWLATV